MQLRSTTRRLQEQCKGSCIIRLQLPFGIKRLRNDNDIFQDLPLKKRKISSYSVIKNVSLMPRSSRVVISSVQRNSYMAQKLQSENFRRTIWNNVVVKADPMMVVNRPSGLIHFYTQQPKKVNWNWYTVGRILSRIDRLTK